MSFPIPENLPDPGIEPASLVSPALAGGFFTIPLVKPPSVFKGKGYLSSHNLLGYGENRSQTNSSSHGNIYWKHAQKPTNF